MIPDLEHGVVAGIARAPRRCPTKDTRAVGPSSEAAGELIDLPFCVEDYERPGVSERCGDDDRRRLATTRGSEGQDMRVPLKAQESSFESADHDTLREALSNREILTLANLIQTSKPR
jgi:hypothetical protein